MSDWSSQISPKGRLESIAPSYSKLREQQGQECLRLARNFIDLTNSSSFDHRSWGNNIAPDFRADHTNYPSQTLKECQDFQRKVKAMFPSIHIRILRESVDIDEQTGHTTVWHNSSVTGAPEGVNREIFSTWRFRQDRQRIWLCYAYSMYCTCGGPLTLDGEG